MSVSTDPTAAAPERGVVIAEASEVLGVPMATLRSWETRYGIPDAPRTFRKHRRYHPAALHALQFMRDEIARGQRAGPAARNVHAMLADQGPDAQAIARVLTHAQHGNGPALDRSFQAAATALGVGRAVDELLLPAMRQVGTWSDPSCGSAQETALTEAVRGWVGRRIAFAAPPRPCPPVVLACGPGDEHTIGMEAFALLLRLAGWPCRILGPRIDTAELLVHAGDAQPAGIVVVSQLASARRPAIASVRAVHREHLPVFYAGNAFAGARACRGLPGMYLGTSMQAACATVDDALTPAG